MEKKLIINICASKDAFGGYAENCEGIYVMGDSVREVKEEVLKLIPVLKEEWPEEEWPEALKENWPIEWHFDAQSLLQYYQGIISNAALQRLTGINQKQLWNYANGKAKPRKEAKQKITKALHTLGHELLELSL